MGPLQPGCISYSITFVPTKKIKKIMESKLSVLSCSHTHSQSKEKEKSIIKKWWAPVLSGVFLLLGYYLPASGNGREVR